MTASLRVVSLASGSSGNCILVETEEASLLVDAGLSAKATIAELAGLGVSPTSLGAVLLSHEHGDHVGGVRTLARRFKVPVISNEATLTAAKIDPARSETLRTGGTTRVGPMTVSSFGLPHDSREAVGFFIECDGWRLCLATDLGYAPESLIEYVQAADLVVLEANHDRRWLTNGPYPAALKARILSDVGHLANEDCAQLVARAASGRPQWVWLAHLSEVNNTPRRAVKCVRARLQQESITTVQVAVALRDRRSLMWRGDQAWIQPALAGL